MALGNIVKAFALYVDGFGYFGDGSSLQLPNVKFKTEDYQGGGMFTPEEVVLGGEKLESSFKMTSIQADIITKMKIGPRGLLSYVFVGALSGGPNDPVVPLRARMLGRLRGFELDSWEAAKKTEQTYELMVSKYTLTHGQRRLIHIDNIGMKFEVDGVDELLPYRQALGIV